jgi:hypothetical protein
MPLRTRHLAGNSGNVLILACLAMAAGGSGYPCNALAQENPGARVSKQGSEVELPKPQPIPFSHKRHSQFFPNCLACHQMAGNGWAMSYPPESKCMVCHSTISAESPAISRLAAYYEEHKAVPWVKIYSLPEEVFFSHKTHYAKGKVACSTCHGPVAERDVITPERVTWMEFCTECHKQRKAPANCRSCHNR